MSPMQQTDKMDAGAGFRNALAETDWELCAYVRENADLILASLAQPTTEPSEYRRGDGLAPLTVESGPAIDTVHATDFGATGDGVADSTAAVQAVVDHADALNREYRRGVEEAATIADMHDHRGDIAKAIRALTGEPQ